jgi:hypothetical protein
LAPNGPRAHLQGPQAHGGWQEVTDTKSTSILTINS